MIDENFIRYAIAHKTAQKELYDDDAERRVQLEIEIKHLKGMLKSQQCECGIIAERDKDIQIHQGIYVYKQKRITRVTERDFKAIAGGCQRKE